MMKRLTLGVLAIGLYACGELPSEAIDRANVRADHVDNSNVLDTEFYSAQWCTVNCMDGGTSITFILLRNLSQDFALLVYTVSDVVGGVPVARESGIGRIPPADIAGDAKSGMRVVTNTDAANNPDYVRQVGTGGPVDVSFAPSGRFEVTKPTVDVPHGCVAGIIRNVVFAGSAKTAPASATGQVVGATGTQVSADVRFFRARTVNHTVTVPTTCGS